MKKYGLMLTANTQGVFISVHWHHNEIIIV